MIYHLVGEVTTVEKRRHGGGGWVSAEVGVVRGRFTTGVADLPIHLPVDDPSLFKVGDPINVAIGIG